MILAMLALTFLAVQAAHHRLQPTTLTKGMIPLTWSEIWHLINTLSPRAPRRDHCAHWPRWQRRQQHRAQLSHYKRRSNQHEDHDLRL